MFSQWIRVHVQKVSPYKTCLHQRSIHTKLLNPHNNNVLHHQQLMSFNSKCWSTAKYHVKKCHKLNGVYTEGFQAKITHRQKCLTHKVSIFIKVHIHVHTKCPYSSKSTYMYTQSAHDQNLNFFVQKTTK